MDFDDVKSIIKNVEPEINGIIHLYDLLPFLKFSAHLNGKIRAQAAQQGEPHASSLFFDCIRSQPKSFYTLIAALCKTEQKAIAQRLIRETRKYYEKKKNGKEGLKKVLEEIKKEKRRLGIEDDESDSDHDDPGNDKDKARDEVPRRSSSPTVLYRRNPASSATQRDPTTDGRGSDQAFPRDEVPRPSSIPTVVYRRNQESSDTRRDPIAGGRASGSGKSLKLLKGSSYKRLGKELEKKTEDDEVIWMAIADDENINLDITADEIDKIDNSKESGKGFLHWLHQHDYDLEDLRTMLERLKMDDAVAFIRTIETEGAKPDNRMRSNNLNMASSRDNKDEAFKSKNIELGMGDLQEQSHSLPTFLNKWTINTDEELQPIQVSSSRGSLTDTSSVSSLVSSSSNSNVYDMNIKERQPIQSVGDPVGESSSPNPSMDVLKLQADKDNPVLNKFKDIQESTAKGPREEGIEFTARQDNSTNEGTRETSQQDVPDQSMSTYTDDSTDASAQSVNIPTSYIQAAVSNSIEFSSYSTATNYGTIPDESLKGTQAIQPVAERDRAVPDQQTDAEKLRQDRVHQLDDHPSALGSYTDIQQSTDTNQNQSPNVSMATESQTVSNTNYETIPDESLKGTQAIQPVAERYRAVPDQQADAEKLRNDRIHQLDDHPSALGSFTDIQQTTDANQDQSPDVSIAGQTVPAELISSTEETDLQSGGNNASRESDGEQNDFNSNVASGDEDTNDNVSRNMAARPESINVNVHAPNIPDLSIFDSQNSEG